MPDSSTRRHPSPVRKLAAILFADIAGYTALMQHDEQDALQKLARFKQTLEAKTAEFQGQIIQYYGDGCLIVFDSPVSAVEAAIAIQTDLRQNVPVRIGIHLGDVVFKEGNVFGDAVNIASRIESMGVAGAVLLTQSVRRQIKNHPEFQLASLGSFEFKNVDEPMEVFALANEGFPLPKRTEMEGKLKTVAQASGWKKWAWAAGIALVALAAWLFLKNPSGGKAAADVKFEKSIALLPVKNLSGNPENQYFCDGMMEEIFSRLSNIAALRVISPQSTERYRGSTKPVVKIAEELGVSHLLQGSVQRSDDSIKIILLLTHAGDDRLVWSDEFTRPIEGIFALQTEIAKIVAKELKATIAPDVMARIERVPTTNMEAWDTYQQAQAHFSAFGYKHFLYTVQNDSAYFKTLSLCDRALALDPALAEAWTLKAQAWWHRNYLRELFSENFMDSVAVFARKALALDPNSAMAHAMLGSYFYESGQPSLGLQYLEKAFVLNPNQIESRLIAGRIYMFRGENEKAFESLKIALALAPNSIWTPQVLNLLGYVYLNAADLEKFEEYLQEAKSVGGMPVPDIYISFHWLHSIQGDFDKAFQDMEALGKLDSARYLPTAAGTYSDKGDFEKSLALYDQLNKTFPHLITPDVRHRWAYTLWKTGKKEEAKAMFKEAEEGLLKYIETGRERQATAYYDLAGIHAFLGNKEKAWHYLNLFDKVGNWNWGSPNFIKVDPLFESMRDDPKLKQMLERVFAEKKQLREQMRKWEVEGKL